MTRNKFFARKVTQDGHTFDSVAEFRRYQDLRLLEYAGRITKLEVHPRFVLIPRHKHPVTGKTVSQRVYGADFSYVDHTGRAVIEDVKGYDKKTGKFRDTALSRFKRALAEYLYGIKIHIVQG